MSTEYIKTNWQDGDIITADKMNNIENGIKDVQEVATGLKEDLSESVGDLKSALTNAFKAENSSDIVCNQTFINTGTGVTAWFNYPIPAGQYTDGLYAMVVKTTGTTGTQTNAGYVRTSYTDNTSDNTYLPSEGIFYKIYINPNKTVSKFDFVGYRSADTTTSRKTTWDFIAFTGNQIEKNRKEIVEMGYTVDDLSLYSGALTNIIEPTFEAGEITTSDYALVYSDSTTICRVPSGIVFFALPEVRVHLKDYTKYKFGYLYAGNNGNWYNQRWLSNDYIFSGANNDRKFTFVIARVDGGNITPEEVQGQLQFIYPQTKAQRDMMAFYKTFSVSDNLNKLGLFFTSGNGLAAGSNNAYTTDYIPIAPGMILKCKLDVGATSGRYAVCYYNPTRTAFVSGVEGNQDGTTLTVPDGVGYVRFCNISASLNAAYVIFDDYVMQDQVRTKIESIEQAIIDGTSGTEYMRTGLARVTSELKGKSDLGNLVVIGFSTDQHIWTTNQKAAVRRGLQVLSRLTRNYPFDFICLGGDACEGGSQADTLNEILDNCIEVQEPLYDAWCPVVPITGNHDAAQNNPNMTGAMLFNAHFKRVANSKFLEGWDSTHTNGYWDSPAHNIRFIFFDSTVRSDYTSGQRQEALSAMVTGVPDGYSMVIFSHHPISSALTNSHWQNPLGLQGVINPYANRIICCICGHSHADISETKDGILYIGTTMAMYGTDQDGNTRVINTEQETAFDTFVIDQTAKHIYAFRYGYGSNRDWSYTLT